MDADDVSLPKRFEKQLNFLEHHPDVALCGTDARVEGSSLRFNYPTEPKAIQANLLLGSSLIHPSIMGRTEIFKQYKYDPTKEPAEDYDLFTRLVEGGEQLANLDEALLIYRVHNNQISKLQQQKQLASAQQSMLRMFKLFQYRQDFYSDVQVISWVWPSSSLQRNVLKAGLAFFEQLENSVHPFSKKMVSKALRIKRYNLLKTVFIQEGFSKTKSFFFALRYLGLSHWRQIFKLIH